MGEDPLNDGRVVDRGDELHSPGATRTAQDVPVERSAHQRRPRPVARPLGAWVRYPDAGSPLSHCGRCELSLWKRIGSSGGYGVDL